MKTGAIFLDRDGVINDAVPGGYVLTRAQFRFLPRVRNALAFLDKNSERRIVVVTNQSPIGRGMVLRGQVDALHAWMIGQIEDYSGRIDGVFVCPHKPADGCICRKPQPGLFMQAAHKLNVDLSQSAVVCDTLSDILAARSAGITECYRVCCGLPLEDPPAQAHLYTLVGTLAEAAVAIVAGERGE
jgi:D-glycero-D-manno-heptose 1,7-bisphosphate phosphatase